MSWVKLWRTSFEEHANLCTHGIEFLEGFGQRFDDDTSSHEPIESDSLGSSTRVWQWSCLSFCVINNNCGWVIQEQSWVFERVLKPLGTLEEKKRVMKETYHISIGKEPGKEQRGKETRRSSQYKSIFYRFDSRELTAVMRCSSWGFKLYPNALRAFPSSCWSMFPKKAGGKKTSCESAVLDLQSWFRFGKVLGTHLNDQNRNAWKSSASLQCTSRVQRTHSEEIKDRQPSQNDSHFEKLLQ